MLCICTVTVEVNDRSDAISFLNCIDQLSYIDIKAIEIKEKADMEREETK